MNTSLLEKIDSQGMYKIYDQWPQIARDSWTSNLKSIHFKKIDHIVFVGMGGSGALGDLFTAIFSKTKIHVTSIKGYSLPKTIDKNTLVICISISGNTDETNTVLELLNDVDCKKFVISSGGKMEQFCKKYSILFYKVPQIHSPRSSFTSFLYSLLRILKPILPLDEIEVENSIIELEKLQKQINSTNLNESNPALTLAKWIPEIPMIIYPYGFQSSAIRFKNSLQENSKSHVMIKNVIELCHNGIVSWEQKSNILPILIEGKDDHFKTKERWIILKDFFQENNVNFKEIFSIDGNILSKLITLIYLLDYSTIYKSVLKKIDPSPVKSIDFVKQRLNKNYSNS